MANQDPAQVTGTNPLPPTNEGQIGAGAGGNVVLGVIIPIAALLFIFIVVLYFAPQLAACDDYFIIKLVYPFVFGALGLILGGTIVIDGNLPLFGEKARMRAAGGIAGALLGFAIAHFSQPSECEAKHAIILKRFPASGSISVVHNGANKKREYIGLYDTTSTSVTTTVERANEGTTRDLKFRFGARDKSKDGFKVVLQFYRLDLDGTQKFEFAWSCTIGAELGLPPSSGVRKYQLIESEPLRYELEFNPNFFKEVEEALKKGAAASDVMCLKGRSRLDGHGPLIEDRVSVPFYVSRLKGYFGQELWYVVETSAPPTEQSVAKQPEVVNGELSVGEKARANGSSSPLNKTASTIEVAKPTRQVSGCGATDAQRLSLDKFMVGDDLDANERKELYKQWGNLHCYELLPV
ncbi:hypothetical protein [Bradyrhizobium sp. 2S1]|uniref:hypothetical protein n=1 Tax=Bradyrhizobium sp. 2S1 TaxID=1404429 RepID=UPI00140C89BE|nr:hypothetical protein [Bradyrhizobium sp. 2S1]MCK7670215.1 hypothetical protein [Bradyrhizobium sp. 2S1]